MLTKFKASELKKKLRQQAYKDKPLWLGIVDIITSVHSLTKRFIKETCMQPNILSNSTVVFFTDIAEDYCRFGLNVQLHANFLSEPFVYWVHRSSNKAYKDTSQKICKPVEH